MKVYEGSILTYDAQDHIYRYLAEENGRIVYVVTNCWQGFSAFSRVKPGGHAARRNLFRIYADCCIPMTIGSDGPCTDPAPITRLRKACNNGTKSLAICQTLHMATYNTCWVTPMRWGAETGYFEGGVAAVEGRALWEGGAELCRSVFGGIVRKSPGQGVTAYADTASTCTAPPSA